MKEEGEGRRKKNRGMQNRFSDRLTWRGRTTTTKKQAARWHEACRQPRGRSPLLRPDGSLARPRRRSAIARPPASAPLGQNCLRPAVSRGEVTLHFPQRQLPNSVRRGQWPLIGTAQKQVQKKANPEIRNFPRIANGKRRRCYPRDPKTLSNANGLGGREKFWSK